MAAHHHLDAVERRVKRARVHIPIVMALWGEHTAHRPGDRTPMEEDEFVLKTTKKRRRRRKKYAMYVYAGVRCVRVARAGAIVIVNGLQLTVVTSALSFVCLFFVIFSLLNALPCLSRTIFFLFQHLFISEHLL